MNTGESPEGILAAAGPVASPAKPISDIRVRAGCRTAMLRVLDRRAVETVLAVDGGANGAEGGGA
jgi:hypothetical protein